MIKPVGHYVLIKVPEIKETTEGGIYIAEQTLKKEHAATEVGQVIAFGPTAFKEWAGCFSPRAFETASKAVGGPENVTEAAYEHYKWHDPDFPPHRQYGLEIGDTVEFRKYEGKRCAEDENLRFIPDSHIIGKYTD